MGLFAKTYAVSIKKKLFQKGCLIYLSESVWGREGQTSHLLLIEVVMM